MRVLIFRTISIMAWMNRVGTNTRKSNVRFGLIYSIKSGSKNVWHWMLQRQRRLQRRRRRRHRKQLKKRIDRLSLPRPREV